jgi:hypothetical protein
MTPIHVEIDSSRADFLAAVKAHRRATRRSGVVIWLIASGAMLIIILRNLLLYDNPSPMEWLGMPAIYVVLTLLFPLYGRPLLWVLRLRWSWRFRRGQGRTVTAEYSDEGADVRTFNKRIFCKWDVFSHYVEGPDVFLLYSNRERFVYLPKRVMTPEQVDAFLDLMERHVRLTRFQKRQPPGFPVQLAEPIAPLPGNSALSEAPRETRQINS